MTDEAFPASHRERKKLKTRHALIAVSQRLFASQGYAATTLEQICEEVDIRPQTLLRYFESKAHLAMAPAFDALQAFTARLEDPYRTIPAIDVWREHVEREAHKYRSHAGFYRWVREDPVLTAMLAETHDRYEEALAAALAADAGKAVREDLSSQLLAALLVGGNRAVFNRWVESGAKPATLAANQLAVIDWAIKEFPLRSARRLAVAVEF